MKPPQVINQSLIHQPVDEVFNRLTRPEFIPGVWLAQSDKSIWEGKMVEWKWMATNTHLQLFIKKVIPHKLISTVWQEAQISVDFEFYSVTNKITLLTFRAYDFKENEIRLYRAMKNKHSLFDIAVNGLMSYTKQQKRPNYFTIQVI